MSDEKKLKNENEQKPPPKPNPSKPRIVQEGFSGESLKPVSEVPTKPTPSKARKVKEVSLKKPPPSKNKK